MLYCEKLFEIRRVGRSPLFVNVERIYEMKKSEMYQNRISDMLTDILIKYDLTLYDVDYVKEGEDYYLRVFIDKKETVTIDDCEKVSRELAALLDKDDFIEDAYILEVSSVGLTRALKKEKEFFLNKGKAVEVKLFQKDEKGNKEYSGILTDFDSDNGKITVEDKGEFYFFNKKDVSIIRLSMDYERE